jgi:hypothetical protein
MQDPSLDASEVEIQVVGGRVTLEGSVDSRMEKYQIEDVVEATGVSDVQNNLRISRGSDSWQSQSSGRGGQSGSSAGTSGSTSVSRVSLRPARPVRARPAARRSRARPGARSSRPSASGRPARQLAALPERSTRNRGTARSQ